MKRQGEVLKGNIYFFTVCFFNLLDDFRSFGTKRALKV